MWSAVRPRDLLSACSPLSRDDSCLSSAASKDENTSRSGSATSGTTSFPSQQDMICLQTSCWQSLLWPEQLPHNIQPGQQSKDLLKSETCQGRHCSNMCTIASALISHITGSRDRSPGRRRMEMQTCNHAMLVHNQILQRHLCCHCHIGG